MRLVTAAQRTPEWFAARLGRVTGSRMKDVVAIGAKGQYLKARDDYRRELVAERIYGNTGVKDVFVTDAMKWGTMNESIARTNYCLRTGNKVAEEGFIIHQDKNDKGELVDYPLGVSTDGLVNEDGNLEIKCLEPHNHLYTIMQQAMNVLADVDGNVADIMPDAYRAQVQSQLWVTGRDWCDFVGYDSRAPKGLDLMAVRIYRDEMYIAFLKNETEAFLAEVERDFKEFLKYLPVAERLCRDCGTIFTDKIAFCQGCSGSNTAIEKIIEPPQVELMEEVLRKQGDRERGHQHHP